MNQQQKDSRATWRKRLVKLVECTKLEHNDDDYMHVSDLIELIWDIPDYDMSKADRKKWMGLLGVKD